MWRLKNLQGTPSEVIAAVAAAEGVPGIAQESIKRSVEGLGAVKAVSVAGYGDTQTIVLNLAWTTE